MSGTAVGRAAAALPWLCPRTDSLIRLAERPADLARRSPADPAVAAFALRFAPPTAAAFTSDVLGGYAPARAAATLLQSSTAGWPSPDDPVVRRADDIGRLAAVFARRLAERTGRTPPDAAAVVARLAPLGWYAVAVAAPESAANVLADPRFHDDPAATQVCHWGLDHSGIVRRLVGRWHVPAWAASALGAVGLPFAVARAAVADPDLFAVVRLAVAEAERRTSPLGLTGPSDRDELLKHLGLSDRDTAAVFADPPAESEPPRSGLDPNPHRVPLVRNLLAMAANARRRAGGESVARLEVRVDELHQALGELGRADAEALRDAKLAGLAELAAGAGHEINNPLAVISGQAQWLLKTEADPDRVDALRSVVRQTRRIADILRDLRLFARPPLPTREPLPVADLLAGVWADLLPLADERGVRVDRPAGPTAFVVDGDPDQLRRAVGAVVRNAVEAAGPGGWVGVRCEPAGDRLRVVVEDGGRGLTAAAAEHAFDPFYSGRSAGRGRGLGLPTAWRLARANGGDVRFEPSPDGRTRFVVTLPLAAATAGCRAA